MDALEAIFNRRSIRKYTDAPVSEKDLQTILKAGMLAPSANNKQPWQFVVVNERETLTALAEVHPYAKMLLQAPLAIVVCGDRERSHKEYWVQDCAAATQNILIAATALGLGSVWLGVHPNESRVYGVSQLLALPDEKITPFSIVALGYPAEEKGEVDRYQPDWVHYNRW